MFGRLFRRGSEVGGIASVLYGAIVAQARNPVLYTDFGVADTVTGRFEMVVLHTALVLDRLTKEGESERVLGQAIFDLYCQDMDRSLRELGIGDLGVPKRMKKMTEAFYGRAGAYREAAAAGDIARLADALSRNVYPGGAPEAARALAAYVVGCAAALALTSPGELRAGDLRFADLSAHAPRRTEAVV